MQQIKNFIYPVTLIILGIMILVDANASFKYKIEYTNNKGWASQELKAKTQVKLDKKLSNFISRSRVIKGNWNKIEADSIASRQGIDRTEYYHPSNFKLVLPTQAELDQEEYDRLDVESDKAERKALKLISKLDKQPNESVAKWRKRISRILKFLLKRI